MPHDAGAPELRAAVLRDGAAAPGAGAQHVGARLLLLVGLFAASAALLALAIAGGRHGAPQMRQRAASSGVSEEAGAWAPLARLAGNGVEQTRPFRVRTARWRLRWTVKPRSGVRERYFRIEADLPGVAAYPITVSVNATTHGACVLAGPGECVLTVFSRHTYEVVAEEWRPTGATASASH